MECLCRDTSAMPCKYYLSNPPHPGYCSLQENYRCLIATEKIPAVLSPSAIQSFQKCKYQYCLSYILGIQLKDEYLPVSVKIGKAVDFALRILYESGAKLLTAFKENDTFFLEDEGIAVAKVNSILQSYPAIQEFPQKCQFKFTVEVEKQHITGVLDRLYGNYFVETKVSSRPDIYENLSTINDQVGTYFLADEKLEKAIIETLRVPQIKPKDNEPAAAYEKRLRDDIAKRPKHYLSRKTFYRSEFNLDELIDKYRHIAYEIKDSSQRESFYRNFNSCNVPYPCMFKEICDTGEIGKRYKVREKGNG